MALTWTDEQIGKLVGACEEAIMSGEITGSDEYWEYVVKKVGDGKTVKDCKEEYEKIYLTKMPTTWTQEETTKLMAAMGPGGERLVATWTSEELRKFKATFISAADNNLATTEFWDCMAKEIGSTKTVADCKELFVKASIRADCIDDEMQKNKK